MIFIINFHSGYKIELGCTDKWSQSFGLCLRSATIVLAIILTISVTYILTSLALDGFDWSEPDTFVLIFASAFCIIGSIGGLSGSVYRSAVGIESMRNATNALIIAFAVQFFNSNVALLLNSHDWHGNCWKLSEASEQSSCLPFVWLNIQGFCLLYVFALFVVNPTLLSYTAVLRSGGSGKEYLNARDIELLSMKQFENYLELPQFQKLVMRLYSTAAGIPRDLTVSQDEGVNVNPQDLVDILDKVGTLPLDPYEGAWLKREIADRPTINIEDRCTFAFQDMERRKKQRMRPNFPSSTSFCQRDI